MREFANRFKEPSSWAGIAALLSLVAPLAKIPADSVPMLIQVGTGVAGLVAIFLPEKR